MTERSQLSDIELIHIGMRRAAKIVEQKSKAGEKSSFALAIMKLANHENMKAHEMHMEGRLS